MRLIYSILMTLLTPLLLLRLWWKARRLPAYRLRWSERFCLHQTQVQTIDVWVHAVSLGEVIAATPLIDALLDKNQRVLITTMTPTGSQRVTERFGGRVRHQYAPYDIPLVLNRFFKQVKPRLGLIIETELWPNLIHYATKAGIPLVLVNARLSPKSLQGYLRLKWFFQTVLNQFAAILTQSETDSQRFIALGANPEKVQALGNIKFDLQLSQIESQAMRDLKALWGSERVVFIAASTHEGEESALISEFRRLQQAIPQVLVLIAPRHPERFQSVYQFAKEKGFKTGLRSVPASISQETEVVVLDSLGELLGFFQVSDFSFVGGSLVPVGGHNVLEPIAMGVPVISGQHVHNFATICRELRESCAIVLVDNAVEVTDAVIQLHNNQSLKDQMVQNASEVLVTNKGALGRYLEVVFRF